MMGSSVSRSKPKDHSTLLITTNNLKMGAIPKNAPPQGQLSNKLPLDSDICAEIMSYDFGGSTMKGLK